MSSHDHFDDSQEDHITYPESDLTLIRYDSTGSPNQDIINSNRNHSTLTDSAYVIAYLDKLSTPLPTNQRPPGSNTGTTYN